MIRPRTLILLPILALLMGGIAWAYRRALPPSPARYLLSTPIHTRELAALTVKSWQLAGCPGNPKLRNMEVCVSHVWPVGGDYLVPMLTRTPSGGWRDHGFITVIGRTGDVITRLHIGYRESDEHLNRTA